MKYIDKKYVEKIIKDYNDGKVIPRRQNIFYNGIQNTLNNKMYYILNHQEKIELAKCYNDITYFIEKYIGIKLRPYQIELLKLYKENKFTIYNVARQTGYRVIVSGIILYEMIFLNKHILFNSVLYASGDEVMNTVKMYYIKIPYFLKPSLISKNTKKIVFNNSSLTINRKKNSDNSYDTNIYMDYAYNVDQDIMQKIFPEVDLKKDSKLIIHSTPNGINHFYDLYQKSILPEKHPDKNKFKSIQTFLLEVEGQDENLKKEEIKRLGSEQKFNQEHGLQFINKK